MEGKNDIDGNLYLSPIFYLFSEKNFHGNFLKVKMIVTETGTSSLTLWLTPRFLVPPLIFLYENVSFYRDLNFYRFFIETFEVSYLNFVLENGDIKSFICLVTSSLSHKYLIELLDSSCLPPITQNLSS